MPENSEKEKVKVLFGAVFKWVLVAGVLLSVLLFVGSYYPTLSDPLKVVLKEISMIILGGVIVIFLHQKILGEYFQQQSKDMIIEAISPIMKSIIPEVKEETVKSIDDIRKRVSEASEFMLRGIGVLTGAKAAGIINIFPTRYEKISGESVIDAIAQDIQAESSSIKLMGISLGDYFLDRGVLHKNFLELLKNSSSTGIKIRALLVHPKCEALRERARWEAGPEYYNEPAFFDSTTFIETEGAARIANRLCQKYGSTLNVRLYKQAPTTFVLLTSRFVFIEPYHYAARGSNVPIFQVQAGAELYRFYESHFERIWEVSEAISEYHPFKSESKKER